MLYDMSFCVLLEMFTLSKTANLCRTSGSQIGSSQGLLSTWTWPTTTCLGTFKRLVISYVKCNLARRFLTIQNYQESWVGSLPCLAGASCRLGNHMVCIVFSCNFFIICIFFNPLAPPSGTLVVSQFRDPVPSNPTFRFDCCVLENLK